MENGDQTFQHIAVTISENDIENGAYKVLQEIRPYWQPSRVKFKLLTDGITNKLVGCRPEDAPEEETVLVRIYGNKTDLIIDRKAETRNILTLSKQGLAPNLYATFENGLAYRYQPGYTLNKQTVRDPLIYPLIARKMAKLHKAKVEGVENPRPFIWKKLRDFLNLVPEEFTNAEKQRRFLELGLPSQSDLNEELICLQKSLEKTETPIVFCHNDLLLGNVIYTESENDVTFIDYEYAAFNYQPFDIANHFAEFAGIDLDNTDYKNNFPSKEFQKEWIEVYLQEFFGIEPNENEIEELYVKVTKFVLVSHMLWGVWGLIQAEHSSIDYDYMKFAKIRFTEYFTRKEEFLSLKSSL
ncbi:ethanolamine kinase isoform X1 [Sitophilus oryzae]|uniref:ethanolamine kinase n=1 Tax=Sitophilus oryzae TaxID=7048 RepID=A0A6J2YH95_SITOR|nr:ethanolamine kinase isoform X1 [Sitophilus oryzae]